MVNEGIIDKINSIYLEFEKKKGEKKVLVMHPSTMELLKDKITRFQNIYNTREAFLFDGKITLYLSFKLAVNNFSFMTNSQYEEHFSPKN